MFMVVSPIKFGAMRGGGTESKNSGRKSFFYFIDFFD